MPPETWPATLQSALQSGLRDPAAPEAVELSAFLARACGPTTVAILHYGSHAQGRRPRADSAYDFFVIVDRDRDAYRSLAAAVGTPHSPVVATILARVLPPNVIAVTQPSTPEPRRAKCCVLSAASFDRACSARARDHFIQGRLLQRVVMTWSRDAAGADAIAAAVSRARARSYSWGRLCLPPRFTVDDYAEAVIGRSLAGEIRPEAAGHARRLVEAQRPTLRAIYGPLLEHLRAAGTLSVDASGAYSLTSTPGWLDHARLSLYFRRSKARATARLLKHVVLYEGWLDYIVRKIDRSGGLPIVLTDRERRWPLIFLWPRVFQYLRTRPQHREKVTRP